MIWYVIYHFSEAIYVKRSFCHPRYREIAAAREAQRIPKSNGWLHLEMWIHVGVNPKMACFPLKWMVKIMENPIKMDDLGVALYLETPMSPLFRTHVQLDKHQFSRTTLPETNIAPENRPSQKEIRLPTTNFHVRAVSFREGLLVNFGGCIILGAFLCRSLVAFLGALCENDE